MGSDGTHFDPSHNDATQIELLSILGYLERVPYRHYHALLFLSHLYRNPQLSTKYPEVINMSFQLVQEICQTVTDEPAIYTYQIAVLLSHFKDPPLPPWVGIPTGDLGKTVWLILQYYPSLSNIDKYQVKLWAREQLQISSPKAYDTAIILQYFSHVPI